MGELLTFFGRDCVGRLEWDGVGFRVTWKLAAFEGRTETEALRLRELASAGKIDVHRNWRIFLSYLLVRCQLDLNCKK